MICIRLISQVIQYDGMCFVLLEMRMTFQSNKNPSQRKVASEFSTVKF